MNNEITTIDTNNYAVMAKAMGMAGETASSDDKPKTLPRFRINHTPIMGTAEVNGKKVNVEVVEGGTYKLEIPDEQIIYATSAKIRPFIQRFMYKRFVKNMSAKAGEPMGIYHKTIMSDNLNIDLKDNLVSAIITPDKDIIPGSKNLKPAFIVFDNYELILKWNRSLRFALAVCTLKDKFKNEL